MNQEPRTGSRVAIYARVSTEGQERDGTSLDAQQEALRRFSEERGLDVVGVFAEAFTGTADKRPQLDAIRVLAGAGAIDAVLVYAGDRLARDGRVALNLLHELEGAGVAVYAVNGSVQRLTLGDDDAALRTQIDAVFADQERRRIVRKLRDGRDRARAEGRRFGRPPVGFTSRRGKLIPDPAQANELAQRTAAADRIRDLKTEGMTLAGIAEQLTAERVPCDGQWHAMRVSRLMRWARDVEQAVGE
jgi:site-specific DNA recombinase